MQCGLGLPVVIAEELTERKSEVTPSEGPKAGQGNRKRVCLSEAAHNSTLVSAASLGDKQANLCLVSWSNRKIPPSRSRPDTLPAYRLFCYAKVTFSSGLVS